MTEFTHIQPDELILYALHALEPDETEAVAKHVNECEQCRLQVAEARGDMAMLALAVDQVPLPSGAEERFMARISADPAGRSESESSTNRDRPGELLSNVVPFQTAGRTPRAKWPVIVPWVIAAGASAVAIALGVQNKGLNDTIGAETALLNNVSSKASHAQQIVDALSSPHAQRVTLTATKHSAEPTGQAIYLADRGSLLFQASNLKPLEQGKTYELWVIPADGKAPVPAGTFQPDGAGYASVVLPKLPPGIPAKAFGVTIENAGGATTPTMPIILAGG